MVAIWQIDDGQLRLNRHTQKFPYADIDNALDLLRKNIAEERLQKSTAEESA
jgi:hypothetical protein